jgi:hypothetical protein
MSSQLASNIRDTMFGDLPLEAVPSDSQADALEEPWITFAAAREVLAAGRPEEAIELWRAILALPNLESLHYAQAWHFLRAQGAHPPPEIAKTILGVVVEVGMDRGLDLLAAYPDHTARYHNFSGRSVAWEHPDDSLDASIDALLAAGTRVLKAINPWPNPRRAAPLAGVVRINLLSPAGLHFGEGPMQMIAAEPLARPTFDAATILMKELIRKGTGTPMRTNNGSQVGPL